MSPAPGTQPGHYQYWAHGEGCHYYTSDVHRAWQASFDQPQTNKQTNNLSQFKQINDLLIRYVHMCLPDHLSLSPRVRAQCPLCIQIWRDTERVTGQLRAESPSQIRCEPCPESHHQRYYPHHHPGLSWNVNVLDGGQGARHPGDPRHLEIPDPRVCD